VSQNVLVNALTDFQKPSPDDQNRRLAVRRRSSAEETSASRASSTHNSPAITGHRKLSLLDQALSTVRMPRRSGTQSERATPRSIASVSPKAAPRAPGGAPDAPDEPRVRKPSKPKLWARRKGSAASVGGASSASSDDTTPRSRSGSEASSLAGD